MLGKDLSNALSGIADDKIESAMNAYARRKARVRQGWLRVAAVAATLAILLTAALWPVETEDGFITAPGVMKVYAHNLTEEGEQKSAVTNMIEDVRYEPNFWTPGMSRLFGLPFSLEIPDGYFGDQEITFAVSANHGAFWKHEGLEEGYAKLGDSFKIQNDERIFWKCSMEELTEVIKNQEEIYADICVYAGQTLVGYGIIEIGYTAEGLLFPLRCDTACFPPVNGELQAVPADYVGLQMEDLRNQKIFVSWEDKQKEINAYWDAFFDGKG